MASKKRLLILTQVYVPDSASVGQHLADVASEVASRGFPVRVLTSACGYDDPSVRYPAREMLGGVDVVRLPLSSFGKRTLLTRLAGQALFLAQTLARGALTPDCGAILVSTSPPMASAAALIIAAIRRVPIVYWAMDINPDQAVSLGAFSPDAIPVRLLDALNRLVLGRAKAVVTPDRFMADRLNRKRDVTNKMVVFPPWPHDDHLGAIAHADNPFRHRHGLDGRTVIMYSGNHGPSNPIRTLLDAAERLKDRKDIVFAFIGGGVGKKEVAAAVARGAGNLLDLPYQPMAELRYSLSAADAHVVTLGNSVVGVVHPCKVYGAMAVARPLLYVGPRPSHVTDLLDRDDIGWQVEHGDVDGTVRAVLAVASGDRTRLDAMGRRAQAVVRKSLSKAVLCTHFGGIVQDVIEGREPNRTPTKAPELEGFRDSRRTSGARPRSRP